MGNCQAVDAAALVIQHPNGKQERMYRSITASEVMKLNPGHYISLIIPLQISDVGDRQVNSDKKKAVHYTRVKLLRPSDILVLGRAYRLVTTQEVMKVLRTKKHAKMRRNRLESEYNSEMNLDKEEKIDQVIRSMRHHQRSQHTNASVGRSKSWRPSLQSISESAS